MPVLGNNSIPSEISNWRISFDPHSYASSETWWRELEPVEDLLQLQHTCGEFVIDAGCYSGVYIVMVIKNYDWESPLERIVVSKAELLNETVNRLVVKYGIPLHQD